ncbi:MAG: hypothetical protein EXS32_07485 [Opitutus sp.]|nr:hypothetical protein [Opitutus sp.]
MELSGATLERLRDEAYAFLCRRAVEEKLVALAREKEIIASTRPPFTGRTHKVARAAYTRSMRTALDNEAALRDRLAQIGEIEAWLQPMLRSEIAGPLTDSTPEFARYPQIRARLDDWQQSFRLLPELLVPFARELRSLRQATTGPAAARQFAPALAKLRELAGPLEQQHHELLVITGAVGELTGTGPAGEICAPPLPDFRRVTWVNRLAVVSLETAAVEVTHFEAEVRAFLAGGIDTALARAEASRDLCTQLENRAVEKFWAPLRRRARAHFVEDSDIDDVLATLTKRYGSGGTGRRTKSLTMNPFFKKR